MEDFDLIKRLVTLESGLAILSAVLLLIVRNLWKKLQEKDAMIDALQESRVMDAKAAADAQIALADRLRATTEDVSKSLASLKDLLVTALRYQNPGE